jgi:hypothetical protein
MAGQCDIRQISARALKNIRNVTLGL